MPGCLTWGRGVLPTQLALMFMLLLVLARGAEAARDISPQRECANCHIAWLVDFNRKDVTTLIAYNPRPVEATGKQDVVSTDRMCFSCHDGFVLDSRFAWKNRQNFHPIGVKPSDKVKIPTVKEKMVFPLNDDGKVYCGTCHSAHGVEWGDKNATVFMRMKTPIPACAWLATWSAAPGRRRATIEEIIHRVKGEFGDAAMDVLLEGDSSLPHGKAYFDLWLANQLLLQRSGVRNIEITGLCTVCHNQDWFSHRAEKGKTGRFGVLIALQD